MSGDDPVVDELTRHGVRVETDRPLGPLTTYRVGGPARWFVAVTDDAQLGAVAAATAALHAAGVAPEVLVVGNGSNLLIADAGFDGLVVHLEGFDEIRVEDTVVDAGGATLLPVLARRTVRAGLIGFEWAVGVPGSLGGAVRMNAGGHGSDLAASLVEVHLWDLHTGENVVMPAAQLDLGYRRSALLPHHVVSAATLQLRHGDAATAEAELSGIVAWRREHQPGGQNAGSVFRNPTAPTGPTASAGELIDRAGCRGLRIGTAVVSDKHANFIQADPGGSADDVRRVIEAVRDRVRAVHGIDLQTENVMIGFTEGDHP